MAELLLGDFRDRLARVPANSVDFLLTDPPYGRAYRALWSDAARAAARVLKPGGFFVAYSGHHGLPEILERLSAYLEYYWLGMVIHARFPRRDEVKVFNAGRPLLMFCKPPRRTPESWFVDILQGAGAEKLLHRWQQPVGEAKRLIRIFRQTG